MSGSRNELSDVRQALLGLADEISATLSKNAANIDSKLKQLNHFQQRLAELSLLGVGDSVDAALKQRLADALNTIITQSNHANLQLKQQQVSKLSKVVNDVKNEIAKPGSGRR